MQSIDLLTRRTDNLSRLVPTGSKLKPRQQYELNNTQSVLMRSRYYHPTRKAVSNPNDINTRASIALKLMSGRLRVINLELFQNKSGLFLPLFYSLDLNFIVKNNFTYFLNNQRPKQVKF